MKKRNDVLTVAAAVIAVIMALSLAACPDPNNGNGGGGQNVPGATLAAKLAWLQTNAKSNAEYSVTVGANETIASTSLSYTGKTDININMSGGKVSLSSNGAMFTVGNGVALTLSNITLQGKTDNNASLIQVNSGGALIMEARSKIVGNTGAHFGGGVRVNDGTFTMNNGEISGNTANFGGGVHVDNNGTFTMHGGKLSGNTATLGGGVRVVDGAFTMNNGEISGNTATSIGYDGGGGVIVSTGTGTFTMNGGTISGNSASTMGGGVFVGWGTFRISNGIIYGSNESNTNLRNTATSSGPVLYRGYNGIVEYGTFSGNTWNKNGDLTTTNNTIRVVNGVLQ